MNLCFLVRKFICSFDQFQYRNMDETNIFNFSKILICNFRLFLTIYFMKFIQLIFFLLKMMFQNFQIIWYIMIYQYGFKKYIHCISSYSYSSLPHPHPSSSSDIITDTDDMEVNKERLPHFN